MRSQEPGCLLCSLLESRREPRAYIVQEQYVDQAALDAHLPMPTLGRIGPFRFFFYSNEGAEPPHIHVQQERKIAKF
jgi:hypothetical protein